MTDFSFDQDKPKGTNRTVSPTVCETCGGDRFVEYQTRPVEQSTWMRERGITPKSDAVIPEYAPCPDCHTGVVADYWLLGKPVRVPDPAQVRARLEG